MIFFCVSCGDITLEEGRDCPGCVTWIRTIVVPFHVRRRKALSRACAA